MPMNAPSISGSGDHVVAEEPTMAPAPNGLPGSRRHSPVHAALAQARAALESLVREIDELHLPDFGTDAFASLSEASVDAMLAKLMGESVETSHSSVIEPTEAEAMAIPSPAEAADAVGALPEPPVREPVPADRLLQTLPLVY